MSSATAAVIIFGSIVFVPPEDMDALAMNAYHEARGEGLQGMVAVSEVVLNRVASNRYPGTIRGVVWQPHQFSWTNDGRSDRMRDEKLRELAYVAARIALRGRTNVSGGATHYHATYARPVWRHRCNVTAEVGNHIFYTC